MQSIWNKEIKRPQFEKLSDDIKADVLVIGGGMTGILCAYMMKNAGVDCILAEADEICSGITKNTTAKITCQHGLIYDKLIKTFGVEAAALYMEAQKEALESYRNMSALFPCDFEEKDSFVYSRKSLKELEKEAEALSAIGCSAVLTENTALPFPVKGAVGIKKQAQFNPLKLAFSAAENLPVYENTKVRELRPDGAITEDGIIKAQKIVVATHFPFINKHGSYFLKMYQHRSYVTAFENAPLPDGMYVDECDKGMSFRSYNGALLIGGGGHRTGKSGGGWEELSSFAGKYYPEAKEICRWATQDCMTLDSVPYIGQYSKNTPNLYVATGFNKWGMTSAMVAASVLCDMVLEKKNKYADVFSPSRSIIRPQLAVNAAEAILGLITPTVPRCPHMGCALKYNRFEHSWDCSCHGSRFTEKGELIDNPSAGNMKQSGEFEK